MIYNIKVEGLINGIGIDSKKPFISWKSDKKYDGFRIIISTNKENIKNEICDFFDTGNILSNDNYFLLNEKLTSRTIYYIRIKPISDIEEDFSSIYSFETGIFGQFFGIWIEDESTNFDDYEYYKNISTPIFYKEFLLDKKTIEKGRLYITGLGYYEAKINGQKITESVLNPAISTYDKQTYYDSYDIKKFLNAGKNIIEIELGNGMYNVAELHLFSKYNIRDKFDTGHIKMICDMEIKYEDGKIDYIWSDRTWKCKESNRIKNDLYLGEHVDFSKNDFKISGVIEGKGPQNLVSTFFPKIHRTRKLDNPDIFKKNDGYIIDFKQNFNGHLQLEIQGQRNELVSLIYGESLDKNGNVDTLSTIPGGSMCYYGPNKDKKLCQKDQITLSGNIDLFENKFTMHSYRFVQIKCTNSVNIISATGFLTNTNLETVGLIQTDNIELNKLFSVAIWTKLSNIYSIHADTARERLGYGGDIVCNAKSVNYIFNSQYFHEKIISDFIVEQDSNGGFTETAPYAGIKTKGLGRTTGPIDWQFVVPYLMKINYMFYGNKRVINQNYDYLIKQIQFLESLSYDFIMSKGIGDWYALNRTDYFQHTKSDHSFTSIIFLYLHYKYAHYFANVLNKEKDSDYFRNKMETLKKFIINSFKNEDGTYHDKSQTSFAYVIYAEIDTSLELINLFENKIKKDGILTSGIFGMMMSYEILNKYNKNELIINYLLKRDNPSFLKCIENGATTIWENFDVTDNCEGSQNHSMFTSFTQWYFEALGGITIDNDAIGFDKISLKPFFSNKTNNINCSINTPKGKINSSWKRENDVITWNVSIPSGICAKNLLYHEYRCKNIEYKNTLQSGEYEFVLEK